MDISFSFSDGFVRTSTTGGQGAIFEQIFIKIESDLNQQMDDILRMQQEAMRAENLRRQREWNKRYSSNMGMPQPPRRVSSKLEKLQVLADRGATEGERAAARAAIQRLSGGN